MDGKNDRRDINLPIIRVTQIARPEGSETAYYTGVSHVRHVNNPKLITLLFSEGRHDGGSNTYLTIDTSSSNVNPFIGAQEKFIDTDDVSTYTWVSSYTLKEDTADGSKVLHYALFSGGNAGSKFFGPSKMYAIEEDTNGQLQEPQVVWIQDTKNTQPARYCLLTDLGDIYDKNDVLVSKAGMPDIIISGLGGLDIYSQVEGEGWKLVRSLPLFKAFSSDNLAGTSSYMGVTLVDDHRLAISSRSRWNITNAGLPPDSPGVLWDYLNDKVVGTFSPNAQTVSVDFLHKSSQILVGAGGEANYSPQPNLFHDIMGMDDESIISLSDTQLVKDSPTSYGPTKREKNHDVTSPKEYFTVLESGLTKTRHVKSYSLFGVEVILEVNSAHPCAVYARKSNHAHSHKIIPLPGSEGYKDPTYGGVYARAGDVIVIDDMVYVVIANFNGNNKVYSFSSSELFPGPSSKSSKYSGSKSSKDSINEG